ncbi:MAG: 1,4-dihydroxy-6-naphthoate synthase [Chitinophagaceae bacterium]
MKYTIGFSPCPNDTFIFDALVNGKIDTEGLEFDVILEDVETLNKWSTEKKLDITKLSFPALFANRDRYKILSAGSALGKGVGPLLIAKNKVAIPDVKHAKIAIPGKTTTANFLLEFAEPFAQNKIPYLFSEIEDAVFRGDVDLGVIIHENRFTYQKKGLFKVLDLGEFWEQKTGLPIPLGCIAIKKNISIHNQKHINNLIKKSVEFALDHYPNLGSYVIQNAQEMDEAVMRKHIELYVNNFSIDLGNGGKKAINTMYKIYQQQNKLAESGADLFI